MLTSKSILWLSLFLVAFSSTTAQIVIHSDADWNYPRRLQERPLTQRAGSPDTLPFSAAQPFFDDFSRGETLIDTSLWFAPTGELSTPRISFQMPINPPSRGTATFDGLQADGVPYFINSVVSGTADRLSSHHIDLSSFGPSDSVMLSFFLQAEGRGDAPETTDSFKVYFRTNLPAEKEYRLMYSRAGGSQAGFIPVVIALDQPVYFHEGFQLRFESVGSLNGSLDHWHLDYVFLGPNRVRGEAVTVNDQSITQVATPIMDPYTLLPFQYFDQDSFQPLSFSLTNLFNNSQSTQLAADLSVNGAAVSTLQENLSIAPYAQPVSVVFSPFSGLVLNEDETLQVNAYLNNHNDESPQNDSLSFAIPIDSVVAYDDGEADGSFGMNKQRGFGTLFDLGKADSLVGVQIYFVPQVNYNTISGVVDYLEDQTFRVIIWNKPNADSILESQAVGMRVRYGTENEFQYYPFPTPVEVPSRFWIGIQQTSDVPIGVGYDRNFNRDDLTFFDSEGNWTNTTTGGALMIRPVFYRPNRLASIHEQPLLAQKAFPMLYPQPIEGATCQLRLPQALQFQTYRGRLLDVNGRVLTVVTFDSPEEELPITLPASLPGGTYVWIHELTNRKGQVTTHNQRLLIN